MPIIVNIVSYKTSSDVCVVLVTSMNFGGIGNDSSSFGTYSWTLDFHVMMIKMKSPAMDKKSFQDSASSRVESF